MAKDGTFQLSEASSDDNLLKLFASGRVDLIVMNRPISRYKIAANAEYAAAFVETDRPVYPSVFLYVCVKKVTKGVGSP